ncbi:MAG: polyhydroxyalkanoate synthesis regulator DNA-binding domain-containing protein [Planctomycetota bacterium]
MNGQQIQLRKYSNRRYYDLTRSQHVTLEAIHRLILDGNDVTVTDSKTGEDTTGRVLAQIILEYDSPKLAMFPAALWHQVIRANAPLVREFIEKYFSQALGAFLQSQRQFEDYLRTSLGLGPPLAGAPWARLMLGPFAQGYYPNQGSWSARAVDTTAEERNGANSAEEAADVRAQVAELMRQVSALQKELDRE